MNNDSDDVIGHRFGRRELLLLLGGAGAGAVWALAEARSAVAAAIAASSQVSAAAACVLTAEVTEGPYYIANDITRRNVRDGQQGLPLQLRLTVEDATTCKPISGANVEIWHANAHGVYSGYGSTGSAGGGGPPAGSGPPAGGGAGGGHVAPVNSLRFLRGHQVSDSTGLAVFDTLYPGWYSGRAPHIHVKVHLGGATVHTGQLFFNDALSDAVYRTADYKAHGQPNTTDAQDSIYRQAGGSSAVLHITKHADGKGYIGAMTMGVRR